MKNLLSKSPTLIILYLLATFTIFSCNNEELFVVESSIVEETPEDDSETPTEEEEEEPDSEDVLPPIETVDDAATTTENVPVEIPVLANDSNLPLTGTFSYTDPTNGILSINDNETPDDQTDDVVLYSPNSGFSGTDSFEYTICDSESPANCSTAFVVITVNPNDIATILKAFPSAYGGGSNATGGRGGVLVIVNTLDANAPLSFNSTTNSYSGGVKAAFSDLLGGEPRYIIFSVSGNFNISGGLSTNRNNITVLGQSAPEGGVTFHGGTVHFNASNNVICRYVRSRNGETTGNPIPDENTYGFKVSGGDDIIIDHVSASWGGDKAVLMGTNVVRSQFGHTIQRSTLSDSHTYMQMSNQNPANFNNHGDISCYYNLFARGDNRTPNVGGTNGYIDIINNVVQSNGTKLGVIQWSDDAKVNWDRNYYKMPISSVVTNEFQISDGTYNVDNLVLNKLQLHSRGNYYETTSGIVLDGNENSNKNDNAPIWTYRLGGIPNDTPILHSYFVENEFNSIPNKPPFMSANSAFESVLSDVGANKYIDNEGKVQEFTDTWDQDLIIGLRNNLMASLKNSNNWILPTIPENERPTSFDTDFDGMSDSWEIENFGSLNETYNGDFDNDGYENIEEFYNIVDL